MLRKFADSKIILTFAPVGNDWRDGRVVDCGGLENR